MTVGKTLVLALLLPALSVACRAVDVQADVGAMFTELAAGCCSACIDDDATRSGPLFVLLIGL